MAVFAATGGAFILSGRIPNRIFYDQELYHRPAINQFVAQWPNFDFWHYLSATTPGFHLLMAVVAKFISPAIVVLQTVALLITVALVGVLGWAVGGRARPALAVALALPFLFSPYVVGSGVWLLPDNLGWLGVLCILLIALRPRPSIRWMLAGGAVLLALVFVRQIHAWTAGLIWAAAWLGASKGARGPADVDASGESTTVASALFQSPKQRIPLAGLSLLATLPALALLALFIRYWGGPVPPVFQEQYHRISPAAIVYVPALFGVWGVFFAATWLPHLLRFWCTQRTLLLAVMLLSLLVAIVIPTNDFEAAKHTGLWGLAERFPTIGHTSPLLVALALLGAKTLAGLLFAIPVRQRLIFLAAVAGFSAANVANNDLFQRYIDPFALMLLALMCASARPAGSARLQAAGPVLLAVILAALSVRGVVARDAGGNPTYAHINDPPPPPRGKSQYDDPDDPTKLVPCQRPRPPMPPGKHFWPWG
jgi:hypothetical protein